MKDNFGTMIETTTSMLIDYKINGGDKSFLVDNLKSQVKYLESQIEVKENSNGSKAR